jgi:hypothetical protein
MNAAKPHNVYPPRTPAGRRLPPPRTALPSARARMRTRGLPKRKPRSASASNTRSQPAPAGLPSGSRCPGIVNPECPACTSGRCTGTR